MNHPPVPLGALRVIVTAMIVGSCVVGGTVIFSASRMGGRIIAEPFIGYCIGACALLVLLIAFVTVPKWMPKPSVDAKEQTLLRAFGSKIITQAALVEAMLVVCFVFFLLTHDTVILGMGVALTVALFFLLPNDGTFRAWRSQLRTDAASKN